MPSRTRKNRNFTFTFNNYPNLDLVTNIDCKYIAYSEEVAPTTGTPHLQGYITFNSPKTHAQVCNLMPGCHIEVMHGSLAQNETYCSKAGRLVERGTPPISNDNRGRAEQLRWQRARESAKSGDLDSVDADIYVRYYNTLKNIAKDHATKPAPYDVKCFWIHGPTGTGKSHAVESAFPNCYKKVMDDLKWFDGYNGEDVIYLEDLDIYHIKWGGMIKRLADKWPMQASIKGSMKYIRPKCVIVTSNYAIDEIWTDPNTLEPLRRRFRQIEKLTMDQHINFTQ